MQRTFRIYRFDPQVDAEPRYQEYRLQVEPTDRVLDCLNRIRWEEDPTLGFRMSCAHGVCGSDGVRINGVCALACQSLVKDCAADPIVIDPLPNFGVQKDLMVDLEPFFAHYRAVQPYLLPASPPPQRERPQSQDNRALIDEAIRCILCACCTAACPVTGENEAYLGPSALLRAYRYLFDERDGADRERMDLLDSTDGIWGCQGHGKCSKVCPKEIEVKQRLAVTKKRLFDDGRAVQRRD